MPHSGKTEGAALYDARPLRLATLGTSPVNGGGKGSR